MLEGKDLGISLVEKIHGPTKKRTGASMAAQQIKLLSAILTSIWMLVQVPAVPFWIQLLDNASETAAAGGPIAWLLQPIRE